MEEDFNMGVFGDNDFELNYDDFNPEENENDTDPVDEDTDEEQNNNAVEDESSEEVDSEEEQDEGSEDDEDEEGDSSSNLFTSLTSFIHDKGLLPSLDLSENKIETEDDFVNALKTEIKNQVDYGVNTYIGNLDVDKIANSIKEINNIDNINDEYLEQNIDDAKSIIFKDYLNQGLDEKRASRLLNRLVDLGEEDILEEAKTSLVSLKEFHSRQIEAEREAYEQRVEQDKIEQEKFEKQVKETVFDKKNLINGFVPNKSVQDQVYKNINEIIGKDPNTGMFENKFMRERRESPIDFEVRMYYAYTLTDGFKDFSKITAKGKSSAVKDLEKAFKKSSNQDTGSPAWMKDADSYASQLGDELNF